MRTLWYWLKWLVGFGPGRLNCWWEDTDFYVQWSDPFTGEVYRRYHCTCRLVEYQQEDEDEGLAEGWDA